MDDTKDSADGGLSTLVLESLDNDATEGAKVEPSKATQKQVKASAKRVQDALRAVRQTAEGGSEDEEMDVAPEAPAPAKDDVIGQLDEFPEQVRDAVRRSHPKLRLPVFKSPWKLSFFFTLFRLAPPRPCDSARVTSPSFLHLASSPHQMEGGEEAMPGLDALAAEHRETHAFTHLFDGLVFFLSREVPRYSLEPVIRAFGGTVSWQGIGDQGNGAIPDSDSRITHHIVDRPQLPNASLEGRSYVQPQWVYDSINARMVRRWGREGRRRTLRHVASGFIWGEGSFPRSTLSCALFRTAAFAHGRLCRRRNATGSPVAVC